MTNEANDRTLKQQLVVYIFIYQTMEKNLILQGLLSFLLFEIIQPNLCIMPHLVPTTRNSICLLWWYSMIFAMACQLLGSLRQDKKRLFNPIVDGVACESDYSSTRMASKLFYRWRCNYERNTIKYVIFPSVFIFAFIFLFH